MQKEKQQSGVKLLKDFKEKYNLTWKEVADTLGISQSRIGDLYTKRRKVPHYYTLILTIFINHPEIYEQHKNCNMR